MWKLHIGPCVLCPSPVLPRPKGCRRYMDCFSPRWTFVQKFSLEQIKGTIVTAVWPTYFPSEPKWPRWGTQGSCLCRTVPYHCSWLSGAIRLVQGCLPEMGYVICLPWHPCCPFYLSAKDQINKRFPCYLQWTLSAWVKLLLRFLSQHCCLFTPFLPHLFVWQNTKITGSRQMWCWGEWQQQAKRQLGAVLQMLVMSDPAPF